MQYFSDTVAWIPGSEMKCGSWWKFSQPNITGGAILKTVKAISWLQPNLLFELTGIQKKNSECSNEVLVKNNYPRIYYSEFNFAFSFTFWVDFVLSTTVQLYYISYTIYHIHEIPLMHVNQPRFHSFVHFRQIVAVCEKLTLSGSD